MHCKNNKVEKNEIQTKCHIVVVNRRQESGGVNLVIYQGR